MTGCQDRQEIYATVALAGAVIFASLVALGAPLELALGTGFAVGLLVRAAGLHYGRSAPGYAHEGRR